MWYTDSSLNFFQNLALVQSKTWLYRPRLTLYHTIGISLHVSTRIDSGDSTLIELVLKSVAATDSYL